MSVKFANNGNTTLASGINDSATSITVADAPVFPAISGSGIFFITTEGTNGKVETCHVTGVSSHYLH